MEEGKLLGHIVSKEGVRIDPERVSAILKIEHPRNKTEVQSFLGKINFLKIFLPNSAETLKEITNMLRKNNEVKWNTEARKSFDQIKKALTKASVLISPEYTKDFQIFSFSSEHIIAAILTQKNNDNQEQPIAFFSRVLRDAETRYTTVEKQAYALVKEMKAFRDYILHSKVIAYVPSSTVKDILVQADSEGRRGKWISKL